jgi:hypothetical protein
LGHGAGAPAPHPAPAKNVARLLQKTLYKPPRMTHNKMIKAYESVANRPQSKKKVKKSEKKR